MTTPHLFEYKIENNEPVIYEFLREGEQRTINKVYGFKPYCYIVDENGPFTMLDGRKCRRVETQVPAQVVDIRNQNGEVNCGEADILFTQRYCIDKHPKIEVCNYRKLCIDIETTHSNGFPRAENPVEPVVCVTVYDNYKNKYGTFVWREDLEEHNEYIGDHVVWYYDNEISMLIGLLRLCRTIDADMITGWNNLTFDLPYLLCRCRFLGIDLNGLSPMHDTRIVKDDEDRLRVLIRGRIIFDLLDGYRKIKLFGLESFSLDNVAQHELGESKIFVTDIGKLWKEDLPRLIEYNKKDVELSQRIDAKIGIVNNFEFIRAFAGLDNIGSAMMYSRVIDTLILRMYKGKYVFPTKPRFDGTKIRHIEGAFVMDPVPGLHHNIVVLDMRSLYPSVIKTFNLSMEKKKKSDNCITYTVAGHEVSIDQSEPGVIPTVVDLLMENRKRFDSEMAKYLPESKEYEYWSAMYASNKSLTNSVYGVNTYENFRLHDKDIAESVTYFGREITQWNINKIKNKGYEVVAGDTDSCFVKLKPGDDPVVIGKQIAEYLDSTFDEFVAKYGLKKHSLHIEFDKVYDKLLILRKKKYIGHITNIKGRPTDKMLYAGVGSKRTDVNRMAKVVEKAVVQAIFDGKSKGEILALITQFSNDILVRKYRLGDLIIPMKLEKDMSEYDSNLPRCRAAKWANKNIGSNYHGGSKFFTLYVHSKMGSDIIAFDNVAQLDKLNLQVDWAKMVEQSTFMKLQAIMEVMGFDRDFMYLWDGTIARIRSGAKPLENWC